MPRRRRASAERQGDLTEDESLLAAAKENVLVQMANLGTYPSVRARRARRELQVHGWFYLIETCEVLSYEPESDGFVPLFSRRHPRRTSEGSLHR